MLHFGLCNVKAVNVIVARCDRLGKVCHGQQKLLVGSRSHECRRPPPPNTSLRYRSPHPSYLPLLRV